MTKQFDQDVATECGIRYNLQPRSFLLKAKTKLEREAAIAKRRMTETGNARANLDAYASRARITSANAKYHTAAEHFERTSKHLHYVNRVLSGESACEQGVVVSYDALFDGSDAHLLDTPVKEQP